MRVLTGQDGDDLVTGDDWLERLDLVHSEDRARRKTALMDHLKGRTAHYECEYRVRDGSGRYRWLHDRGLGLRDAHRRVYRMAGAVSDITQRKLAESERLRLEQRLRHAEKLEALGTMAGGIAHDFNNILGSILGYGDMAVHGAPEGSALKRYTTNVMTAANRAKNLVDQILTYSRSGRGRREAVDLRALLEETAELVRASLPEGVHLDVHLGAADATVLADPTQLHQVLMNLCTNGIQAMRAGGRLTGGLEAVDTASERALSHGVLAAGHHLRLWVHDTGCGIPAQVLPRIFEPFFTTKDPGAGTGLGLALVQGIVGDLGGTLHVLSSPGVGSTFEVYLPRSEAPTRAADRQLPLPHGQGQRVLLIDDERARLLIGEEMLAALGYDPAGFTDPHTALDALTRDPVGFDAIVTNQLMPVMTGTQLAARVRQLGKDIPIVLIGGYRDAALEQEARAACIEQFLTKPLKQGDLAQAVAQALAARSTTAP
jgi:PAS domain S-box-containing protein